jgi:hypothetical protein
MGTKAETARPAAARSYPAGQRLQCHNCGAEIEIVTPCTCDPPEQVLQCCGQDMKPTTGQDVHVNVE